jgi:hypothetical protein
VLLLLDPNWSLGAQQHYPVRGSQNLGAQRRCLGSSSQNLGPDGPASAVAGETWGPDGAASAVAGGGRLPASRPADACCWEPDSPEGATLEAEGEEALTSKGLVNARQHGN